MIYASQLCTRSDGCKQALGYRHALLVARNHLLSGTHGLSTRGTAPILARRSRPTCATLPTNHSAFWSTTSGHLTLRAAHGVNSRLLGNGGVGCLYEPGIGGE